MQKRKKVRYLLSPNKMKIQRVMWHCFRAFPRVLQIVCFLPRACKTSFRTIQQKINSDGFIYCGKRLGNNRFKLSKYLNITESMLLIYLSIYILSVSMSIIQRFEDFPRISRGPSCLCCLAILICDASYIKTLLLWLY